MGLKAARIGDSAGHGGLLLMGSFKVLIGNMPAARLGDPLICPGFDGPKAHVMGNITKASTTVMIDGAFAARMGDDTACGAVGISGAGAPAVAGPPADATPVKGSFNKESAKIGTEKGGLGYEQESGHNNEYGLQRGNKVSAQHETATWGDPNKTKVVVNYDAGTITTDRYAGPVAGGVGIQGSVVKADVTLSDEQGNSSGVQGGLLNSQANVGTLLGTDGRRTGIGLSASAQVSAAEGQVDTANVINVPFTDYSIKVAPTLGGSLGSVGAAGSAGIYHDALDDRFHINALADAKVVAGLKIGIDISFGKKNGPSPGGGGGGTSGVPVVLTPGKIMTGCANVEIG
jgi:uncharacterized Zn-binding protein involved in type VI secretion